MRFTDGSRPSAWRGHWKSCEVCPTFIYVYPKSKNRCCSISCQGIRRRKYPTRNAGQLARYRKHLYGISNEVYQDRLKSQGGGCAICGAMARRLCVDHDHETGTFRGVLCHRCNAAIGLLGDTLETVKRAVVYLEGAVSWST